MAELGVELAEIDRGAGLVDRLEAGRAVAEKGGAVAFGEIMDQRDALDREGVAVRQALVDREGRGSVVTIEKLASIRSMGPGWAKASASILAMTGCCVGIYSAGSGRGCRDNGAVPGRTRR